MVWLETPTNPTLKLTDIKAVSKIAAAKDILVAVDNTFMSPFFKTISSRRRFGCAFRN